MGNVNSTVIETALDPNGGQQSNLNPNDVDVQQLTSDPQQRELYRLLIQQQMANPAMAVGQQPESLPPEQSQDAAAPAPVSQSNEVADTSTVCVTSAQSKPIAPKKKFLIDYRYDEDLPEEQTKQDASSAAVEAKETIPVVPAAPAPVQVSKSSASSLAVDSTQAGRSRSHTVSLPFRSRGPPPARAGEGRKPVTEMKAPGLLPGEGVPVPSSRLSSFASMLPVASSVAYGRPSMENRMGSGAFAAAASDAERFSYQSARQQHADGGAPTQRDSMTHGISNSAGYVSRQGQESMRTSFPSTTYNNSYPYSQQQHHVSRSQQYLATSSAAQLSSRLSTGMPASYQTSRYPSSGEVLPDNSSVERSPVGKMTPVGYEKVVARQQELSRQGQSMIGGPNWSAYAQTSNFRAAEAGSWKGDAPSSWPRHSPGAAGQGEFYQRRVEQPRDAGMSGPRYRGFDAQPSGSVHGNISSGPELASPYERQQMAASVSSKHYPAEKHYPPDVPRNSYQPVQPRVDTVRQQVHEQFDSMFPPPAPQRGGPYSSQVPVAADQDQRLAYRPMEPIEPSVRPRISGLMPTEAAGSRSSIGSDRYTMEQMYRSVPNDELQTHRRITRPATDDPPLLFAPPPEMASQYQGSQSARLELPERAGRLTESPLDLTTRKNESMPLTAEAFLRRCYNPNQDMDPDLQYNNASVSKFAVGRHQTDIEMDPIRATSDPRYVNYRTLPQHSSALPAESHFEPRRQTAGPRETMEEWPQSRRMQTSVEVPYSSNVQQDSRAVYASRETQMGYLEMQNRVRRTPIAEDPKMDAWSSKRDNVGIMDAGRQAVSTPSMSYMSSSPRVPQAEAFGHPSPIPSGQSSGWDPRFQGQHESIRRPNSEQQNPSSGVFDSQSSSGHHRMSSWSQPSGSVQSWIPTDAGPDRGPRSRTVNAPDVHSRTIDLEQPSRQVRIVENDLGQPAAIDVPESSHFSGRSPSLPQLSPIPQTASSAAANRRIPIVQLLGSHSPSDILHLRCSICSSTYGSLRSFRMHFAKVHGLEPSPEHFTIQTISDARSAMMRGSGVPDAIEDSQSMEESPPSLQRETSVPGTRDMEGDHRRPPIASDHPVKQVAEVYPIPKKACQAFAESDAPTPVKKLSPTPPAKRSGDERRMKCLKCGHFSTQDWGVFRRHIRTHGEPPSAGSSTPDSGDADTDTGCAVCLEGFTDVADWKLHVASQHMMRSCACKSCDLGFTNAGALRRHLTAAHGTESAAGSDIEVEYRCLFCPDVFTDEWALYAHTHAHEHRYSTQRGQRAGRLPARNSGHSHVVQMAIPDTTCPEDQRSSELLLSSKSSPKESASLSASDVADKELLVQDRKDIYVTASSTVAVTKTSDSTPFSVTRVSAEYTPKLDSRKASILRRLSAGSDGENRYLEKGPGTYTRDHPPHGMQGRSDEAQKSSTSSSPDDSKLGQQIDQDDSDRDSGRLFGTESARSTPKSLTDVGRIKLMEDFGPSAASSYDAKSEWPVDEKGTVAVPKKPKVFGDLLMSMHREVESSLRGFSSESQGLKSEQPAAVTLPSYSKISTTSSSHPAPCVRDLCDAFIKRSLLSPDSSLQISTSKPPPPPTVANDTSGRPSDASSVLRKENTTSEHECAETLSQDSKLPVISAECKTVSSEVLTAGNDSQDVSISPNSQSDMNLRTEESANGDFVPASHMDHAASPDEANSDTDKHGSDIEMMFEKPLCIDLNHNTDDDDDDDDEDDEGDKTVKSDVK